MCLFRDGEYFEAQKIKDKAASVKASIDGYVSELYKSDYDNSIAGESCKSEVLKSKAVSMTVSEIGNQSTASSPIDAYGSLFSSSATDSDFLNPTKKMVDFLN